ncbi:MAG: hypothetical protein VXW32_16105 [Myxococcota bacterium]|nr:hypothetical protein [Myxococcota bacterium]
MNRQMAQGESRWVGALVLLLGGVVFTWPLLLHPTELYGHAQGEASNHLWMFWRAGEAGVVANYPMGLPIPLMDPINLPIYRALAWVHPALGYNAVWCFNLALAFTGAVFLARVMGVAHRASLVAGVACAFSPFLSGLGSFGITESWGIGWLGFHCGFLIRYGQERRRVDLLAAGLTLAAFLWTGWYSAVFAVVTECCLAVTLLRRRQLNFGFVLQGGLASLLVLPRLVSFWGDRGFWSGRWDGAPAPLDGQWEAWRELPRSGADLLNFTLPSLSSVEVSKAVYLGLIVLILAAWAGRRGRLLVLWSLPFVLLSLGPYLMVGGHQSWLGSSLPLPAQGLRGIFPPLEGVTHWWRALAPAVLFLAVAAAMGAERVGRERPRAWILLSGLVLFDSIGLSQTPWPRDLISVRPPPVYEKLEEEGALLQLPVHNERREFSEDVPRIYNRWQPVHGQPVVENYEGRDHLLDRNPLLQGLQALCVRGQGLSMALNESVMWAKELRKQGVTQVVVHGVAQRDSLDAWQCGQPGDSRAQRQNRADRVVDHLLELGATKLHEASGDVLLSLRAM